MSKRGNQRQGSVAAKAALPTGAQWPALLSPLSSSTAHLGFLRPGLTPQLRRPPAKPGPSPHLPTLGWARPGPDPPPPCARTSCFSVPWGSWLCRGATRCLPCTGRCLPWHVVLAQGMENQMTSTAGGLRCPSAR